MTIKLCVGSAYREENKTILKVFFDLQKADNITRSGQAAWYAEEDYGEDG
jgi:hypothetical protein